MHSPMKHAKKTRKNTFSQVAVAQTEVGDFHGGYFVMPDATSSKENDCPHKTRAPNNNTRNNNIERSPARRKHQDSTTSSPHKERNYYDSNKKPVAEMSMSDVKKENSFRNELTTPALQGSFTASPKKSAPASPKHQQTDFSDQKYYSSSKDVLSTSPSSSSGRWAGPAFGNAPHPSSLPLPVWNSTASPFPAPAAVSTPSHHFMTQDSSPPGHHDGASFLGMVYHHHPAHIPFPASPSPPPTSSSSIPVVPFPYVGAPQQSFQMPPPSLAQLSTDLRRMLNIAGPVHHGSIISDPIANSA